jgi:DNA adenine methylase
MSFISEKEAAEKCGVSQKQISPLCVKNNMPGALAEGDMRLIPADARKPEAARNDRFLREGSLPARPLSIASSFTS